MRRGLLRIPLLLLVASHAMACSVPWNAVRLEPRPEPSVLVGAEVRVVRTDGETFVAREARIESDTLVYVTPGVPENRPAHWPKVPPVRVAIPLDEVQSLEVRSVRDLKEQETMWTVLLLVGLVFGIDAYNDCAICHGGW
ncbi:MAG: hypothetical protein IPJ78_01215 [Gemmatimonadetes bacterium]|nr:hypothetical protein [Gemmatimonadota bacterium]